MKVTVDSLTRDAVVGLVREVLARELDRQMEEVWLGKDDFLRQFGMFTEDWLKRYGHLLPRARVTVSDGDGERSSRYAYARNAIQRMIADNALDFRTGRNGKVRGSGA